ncbi:MAG: GNAT family N-acetyltransferase [Terrimesophilobacter sp.]
MTPFTLGAPGLRLGGFRSSDEAAIVEYCQDPVFERFLTIPWPYRLGDAEYFVREYVPQGWADGSELTWALRDPKDAFLGVIGLRLPSSDLGFWLGAPHRGHGYMPVAVRLVTDWVFSTDFGGLAEIGWACVEGNSASMAVARKCGLTYTGVGPATTAARDGSHPQSWHGVLRRGDAAEPQPGWPVS